MVVILDEKAPPASVLPAMQPPPPPYITNPDGARPSPPPPFSSGSKPRPTLSSLPPHLLLNIIHHTFPQMAGIDEGRVERQRRTLYWLCIALRRVNRAFYIACMHVLRSTYLPAYTALLRPPYTSDPFPHTLPPSACPSSSQLLPSPHRETRVLDLFIALKVREDVWADASALHLSAEEESFRDLFELMQPRARCEDLVRAFGARAGIIGSGSSAKVQFENLSVALSPRRVGLVLTVRGARRTVVEVDRRREDPLEVIAKRLVRELQAYVRS